MAEEIRENNLKSLLNDKNIKLTKGEKKIAEYLHSAGSACLTDTISEFSEKADVSEATVVRFCKHIGCKGFQDFKITLARELVPREKQYNPIIQSEDGPEMICEKIFGSEVSALESTMADLDVNALLRISEKIRNARRIVLLGTGGSLNVAVDALHKFMKIGIMVYVYEDMDLQAMAASLLGEEDVIFAISHSGSNIKVLKCMDIAKKNGAFAIALTGSSRNPLAKEADISVKVSSETTMFRSESASTRIAQLAVIDALIALTAFQVYESSYQAIQSTRSATSDNKF